MEREVDSCETLTASVLISWYPISSAHVTQLATMMENQLTGRMSIHRDCGPGGMGKGNSAPALYLTGGPPSWVVHTGTVSPPPPPSPSPLFHSPIYTHHSYTYIICSLHIRVQVEDIYPIYGSLLLTVAIKQNQFRDDMHESVESLQSHMILTMSHWSSGLACLLPITRDPGSNPQGGTYVKPGFSY
jgi:hypothetical protein